MLINWITAIFFIVVGLGMCGAGLPRWAVVVGGVCGIIAGILQILPL